MASVIYNYVPVPIYSTLGDKANHYIFETTLVEIAFLETSKVEKIVKLREEKGWYKSLKTIILLDHEFNPLSEEILTKAKKNFVVRTFEEVELPDGKILPWKKVVKESIYCFSYTGGTTGNPKGVMITH